MITNPLLSFANHLWQSTLFAAAAGLLALLLHKNQARMRYWLWLSASVKFLIPFSILTDIGDLLGRYAASTTPRLVPAAGFSALEQIGEPFTTPAAQVATPAVHLSYASVIVPLIFAVWAIGFALLVCRWARRWRRMRASVRTASALNLPIGLPVRSSSAFGEPGVFGIFRPVLLLPYGIADCLTTQEMDAIVTHELCHVRRRDNLTMLIHIVVEWLFWFHPLIWWLGARLMEERERACDEEVLRLSDPRAYAEGIIKICELYLASPLACVAGVTGGDLKRRIEAIIANRVALKLNVGRKAVLAAAALTAVAVPITMGIVNAPFVRAQSSADQKQLSGTSGQVMPHENLSFEVASVRPHVPGSPGSTGRSGIQDDPGQIQIENLSLRTLISVAFSVKAQEQLVGPGWLNDLTFDILAKPPAGYKPEQLQYLLRNLLVDRFRLSVHHETKPVRGFALVVAKGGPKLHESTGPRTFHTGRMGLIEGNQWSMSELANVLARSLGQPVTNETDLKGVYDLKLEWTPDPALESPNGPGSDMAADPGPSLFTALQEVGLRLESRKVPSDIVVVDHVERVPTEN